ncbi:MAG: GNAT family N-acetyltransferase [Anaerolineales bacterium]|nr:GNAT family N-acetyltransferase [Anaerolineales bacterium]
MQPLETSKGSVAFRPANIGDVEKFRALRLFALKDAPTAFSGDYALSAEAPTRYWENRLKPSEGSIVFLAEHHNDPIGTVGIQQGDRPKTRHSAVIWGVYVRPEWRGLHLAEHLIEACVHWTKSRRVELVKLAVVTENASAIRCYERCGFKTYGTDPRAIYYEGRYYDEYLMAREID